MVSFEAACASFSSTSALSAVEASPVTRTGVSAGALSVPKLMGRVTLSPFSIVAVSGIAMSVTLTPQPASDSAMTAAIAAVRKIFFFIFFFSFSASYAEASNC